MNIRDNFPGTGMQPDSLFYKQREAVTDEELPEYLRLHEGFEAAIAEDLAKELPTPASKDRGIFERSLAVRRDEKAKQLDIAAAAMAKARELTVSIRAMEDALDGMLVA